MPNFAEATGPDLVDCRLALSPSYHLVSLTLSLSALPPANYGRSYGANPLRVAQAMTTPAAP